MTARAEGIPGELSAGEITRLVAIGHR